MAKNTSMCGTFWVWANRFVDRYFEMRNLRRAIMSEEILKEILQKINSLEQGMGSLEQGMSSLEQVQEQTKKELIKNMEIIEERMGHHIEQVKQELKKDVRKLETRMESEVFDKVRALFNGYSLRGDQIENLQKHLDRRLDSIEIDTGYLVSRVARLEKLAK